MRAADSGAALFLLHKTQLFLIDVLRPYIFRILCPRATLIGARRRRRRSLALLPLFHNLISYLLQRARARVQLRGRRPTPRTDALYCSDQERAAPPAVSTRPAFRRHRRC